MYGLYSANVYKQTIICIKSYSKFDMKTFTAKSTYASISAYINICWKIESAFISISETAHELLSSSSKKDGGE